MSIPDRRTVLRSGLAAALEEVSRMLTSYAGAILSRNSYLTARFLRGIKARRPRTATRSSAARPTSDNVVIMYEPV